jgi:hypothetical protein
MAFFDGKLARIALASLLVAAPAYALPRPPEIAVAGDDPSFGDTGLTFFSPIDGRGYEVNASLNTLYDSNILRLGEGQTPRPGAQASDVRFSPVVSGNIGLPVGRQQLFAGALLGGDVYGANTQLNRIRYAVGAGANLSAGSRCTGTIAANYTSRQIIVSEESEVIPNARGVLGYGLSANCQSPGGLGGGVALRQINTYNSAPARESFDSESLLISPYISYGRPTLGQFSLTANLNYVKYPNRVILDPNFQTKTDGTNIFSGRLGYQRGLGSRLQIAAGVSYLETSPQPPVILAEDAELGILFPLQRDKFSGMGYDFSLTYNPGTRVSATTYLSRNVQASTNVGALYQVNTSFGADVNYRIGSSFTWSMGGTYTIRDYAAGFGSPTEVVPRIKDNIGRVYGRLSYAPPRLYSISLLMAYQNRDSNPVLYSYNSFSALLSISFDLGSQR